MHYVYKKEAKVKVAHALEEKGWKIYGYSPDQSDSMTDYYHPASWGGIAEKNGFILLIDISEYGLKHYSGHVSKQYDYNSKSNMSRTAANERINKLTALMEDPASTPNEKASCAVLIEKEQEKLNAEPEYTINETFPIFAHANPKSCSWHIEKDGQILAKGKGVFSTNTYDWENDEKSSKEQKAEKVASFVEKVETVLRDSDALKAETVKIEKKVIKPVQKEDKTVNVNDILSFSYHGHYWIVTNVYTVGNQERVTYELLGSEKRGYNRLNGASVKRYYQVMTRLQKEIEEGKTKVYTLQEVTEIEEKTVYKKTARKAAMKQDVPELTGQVEETETEQTTDNNSVTASYTLNSELNGVEVSFPNKPDQTTIDGLKAHGFRWHKFKKVWYAVQSSERLEFVKSICSDNSAQEEVQEEQPENVTEETTEEEMQETETNNPITYSVDTTYKYHDIHFKAWNMELKTIEEYLTVFEIPFYIANDKFICQGLTTEQFMMVEEINYANQAIIFYDDKYNEKPDNSEQQPEQHNDNVIQFPKREQQPEEQKERIISEMNDIFSKFDNVKVENNSRIAADDTTFCEDHELKYNKALTALETSLQSFKDIQNSYIDTYDDIRHTEERIKKIKQKFINEICWYFEKKYNVTIEENFGNKYNNNVTYNNILDEIFIQLGGYSFEEKASKEIKDNMTQLVTRWGNREKDLNIKGNKISFDSLYIVSYCSIWKRHEISYNNQKNAMKLFEALTHFENGNAEANWEFTSYYLKDREPEHLFEKLELTFSKVKSIKMYKNGRVDVEFSSNEIARQFAKDYCGYTKAA